MREITEAEFTDALKQAVKRNGEDYVYDTSAELAKRIANGLGLSDQTTGGVLSTDSCFYTTDGKTGSCIMGVTLEILGLPFPAEFITIEAATNQYLKAGVAQLPDIVRYAAGAAQSEQDHGRTWGEAFKTYTEFLAQTQENIAIWK